RRFPSTVRHDGDPGADEERRHHKDDHRGHRGVHGGGIQGAEIRWCSRRNASSQKWSIRTMAITTARITLHMKLRRSYLRCMKYSNPSAASMNASMSNPASSHPAGG